MSITVSSGETFRLHTPLSSSATVTLQPDSLLIADRPSFIQSVGDIIVASATSREPAAALEIKHVAPVVRADFSFGSLVLNYANGESTTLHTAGTSAAGDLHPFQTNGGTFYLASRDAVPPNAHSVVTNFII